MGPKGVSVDRNGHIIVVDNKSCCVFIFQPNGKLVSKFGNRGNSDKQFAGTYLGYILSETYSAFTCYPNYCKQKFPSQKLDMNSLSKLF